jgi:hypothetical protein
LHKLAGECLQYAGPSVAVTSPINGTDGIVAIIQGSVSALGLAASEIFNKTLTEHGFSYLKTLRDAVIHAKILDSSTGVGTSPGKRGKEPEEVLLDSKSLEGLYKRLVFVSQELGALKTIINCAKTIRLYQALNATDDQRKQYNELDIRDATARCQRSQSKRLSLPPFPKFPDPPQLDQLLAEWHTSQRDMWFRVERKE